MERYGGGVRKAVKMVLEPLDMRNFEGNGLNGGKHNVVNIREYV